MGRPPVRQIGTISVAVGMQNSGPVLVVTKGVLADPTISIVPVMYGLLMLIPIVSLVAPSRYRDKRQLAVADAA